jgi:hypothetical protein
MQEKNNDNVEKEKNDYMDGIAAVALIAIVTFGVVIILLNL